MNVSHEWLKEYVGNKLGDAKQVEELLGLHAFEIESVEEMEGDTVTDVDILPNRASDSLSHRGIAREIATILDIELESDPLVSKPKLSLTSDIEIKIDDSDACPRFTLGLITGVEIKDSPEWLQKRLRVIGQRPINNVVDATNYVMHAIGQPMHAYDADTFPKVNGKWSFNIRFASEGETVSLLAEGGKDEERVIELKGTELLVVDASSDTPVALAGIKGGKFAELNSKTKNIIVEAAHFDPTVIRKTARRLGILTDASKRFENKPSRELPLYAQRDIVKLITDIAGGEFIGLADEYLEKETQATVNVSVVNVNKLLGLSLSATEVKNIIERTGAAVTVKENDSFEIDSPWERSDLNIEEDYIEEVGRIHGLNNIESVVPEIIPLTEINVRQYYGDKIRKVLTESGFSEVITSTFQKKDKIQLQNALASDKSYIRSSLTKNIIKVLDANFVNTDLLGIDDLRVFEIGTVFFKTENSVSENVSLTLGARTKGNGYNPKDDTLLKLGCDAVADALGVSIEWNIEKGVAGMNLTAMLSELPVPVDYEPLNKSADVAFKTYSTYPAISRDIALWVGEDESVESVLKVLEEAAGELCVRETLFDTFSKDGRTSYAFRLVFQSLNKTLTDDEINVVMEKVNIAAEKQGWEVR